MLVDVTTLMPYSGDGEDVRRVMVQEEKERRVRARKATARRTRILNTIKKIVERKREGLTT